MKKIWHCIFPFLPSLFGWLTGSVLNDDGSVLVWVLYFTAPFMMIAFWFFIGSRYAKSQMSYIRSVLFGNSIGLLSLLLYLWQYSDFSGSPQNEFLGTVARCYTWPLSWFSGIFAMPYEALSGHSAELMRSIRYYVIEPTGALIIMITVFSLGYLFTKRQSNKQVLISKKTEGDA